MSDRRAELAGAAASRLNELWDVVALLHSIEERIDTMGGEGTEGRHYAHQTLRLAQMAREKVDDIAAQFSKHC